MTATRSGINTIATATTAGGTGMTGAKQHTGSAMTTGLGGAYGEHRQCTGPQPHL